MSESHSPYPQLIVVGGPNGAGKTTIAKKLVSELGYLYLGADEIATQLAPNNPESVAIQAGREFLHRIHAELQKRTSIIVESTLSGRSFRKSLGMADRLGYSINLYFVYVESAEECVERVTERVRKGGHHVPTHDVIRRYTRSLNNFWKIYRPLCQRWTLMYNSSTEPEVIAFGLGIRNAETVRNRKRFREFREKSG